MPGSGAPVDRSGGRRSSRRSARRPSGAAARRSGRPAGGGSSRRRRASRAARPARPASRAAAAAACRRCRRRSAAGLARLAQADAADRRSLLRRAPRRARRAPRPPRASSGCRRRRGSARSRHRLVGHRADQRGAVGDRLVRGRRAARRAAGPAGSKRVIGHTSRRADALTGKPSSAISCAARARPALAGDPERDDPLAYVGGGESAMSRMLTPGRARAPARPRRSRRGGWAPTPQLVHRPAGSPGRAAPAVRARLARSRRRRPRRRRREASRDSCRRPAKSSISAIASRLGVDVGPDACWHRPRASRRGSSARPRAARRVAAAGSRAACATSALASTCGRCETVAISRSCVSASIATGRAPSVASSRCSRS